MYNRALEKIIDDYKDYQIDGETFKNGLPAVDDDHKNAYFEDVNDLLHIKLNVDLYKIDQVAFDYEESDRYDPLSALEIIELQGIIC